MSPLMRLALPVLAVASTAYAVCSTSGTLTIQNGGDATALASCTRGFEGSIAIATGTSDPIVLNGISSIDGDLVADNSTALQSLAGADLEEISGTFSLLTVENLNSVSFPKLAVVGGIEFVGLPNLGGAQLGPVREAKTIRIDNTNIENLDTSLNLVTVERLTVVNNRYLTSVNMQLGNVTEQLIIGGNSGGLSVSFPNLIWAKNMTYRNVSSVEVPSLEYTNGTLGFFSNLFESFAAPNLTQVGGALTFVSNEKLTNISMPELIRVVNNFEIANNTELKEIDGFPKLKTISGSLDVNGEVDKIETPVLNEVVGAFNLQSTGDIQKTCDDFFKPLSESGKIRGDFTCEGKLVNPGGAGSTPTPTGGARPTGAASTLSIDSNALGLIGLAAAFLL